MRGGYTVSDLLDFLGNADDRGGMPTATAQALAVAVRNVFSVLNESERADVRDLDLDRVIKRFNNKRGDDFNPNSLKEYGRRARKAVELYTRWREAPGEFKVSTRATAKSEKVHPVVREVAVPLSPSQKATGYSGGSDLEMRGGGYRSAFPVRPGHVVTLVNVPEDLTASEAERLATFVRMLAVR